MAEMITTMEDYAALHASWNVGIVLARVATIPVNTSGFLSMPMTLLANGRELPLVPV
jgi:hypothetical protein